MAVNLAGLVAAVLYLTVCWTLLRRLKQRDALPTRRVLALGALALPLHLIAVHGQIYQPLGLDLGLFNMISLVGWLIATLSILVNLYRPVPGILLVGFPFAILGIVLSLTLTAPYTPLSKLPRGAESHILLSILAYAVLTIAAMQAVLLAIQDRQLRNHRNSFLAALPPLQTMESMLFEMIGAGFVLLSLAILTGFLTLDNMFAQHLVHKTVLTLCAWLIFAVLLTGRHFLGWRGRTAIRFTLTGFVVLLVGFYGSKIVLELILHKPV
jgi:ABC-type uncharacterized transport system permease subunit